VFKVNVVFVSADQRRHFPYPRRIQPHKVASSKSFLNPFTLNHLLRRHAMSPLKIKITGKNMREKPTNTPIIHSVY
jgi:DNA polymerase III delta prime subunit